MFRKRFISVILVLALSLSFVIPSFAESEKDTYKVVAVGDSTSNGCGLSDYGYYSMCDYILTAEGYDPACWNKDTLDLGFLSTGSRKAYPCRLAEYIQAEHPEYDVQFTNLGISGIRNTEIRAIIDDTYEGDSYTGYYADTLARISGTFGYPDLHQFFVDEIKSADLITLDAIMNSFTGYLKGRIDAVMSGKEVIVENASHTATYILYDDSVSAAMGDISPEIKALADTVSGAFRDAFSGVLPDAQLTGIVDAVAYCCISCAVNFTELVGEIRDLNPDARILVGGAYNPIHGKTVVLGDTKIELDPLMNILEGTLNAYLTGVCPYRYDYSYINMPEDIETISDFLVSCDSILDFDPEYLSVLIDDLFGYDHMTATPLCWAARDKGTALGLDISPYFPLYSDSMCAIFENVRALGDEAPLMERLFLETFDHYYSYIFAGARIKEIDLTALASASFDLDYYDIYEMMDTPVENLSDEQLISLYIFVQTSMRNGAGAHFSEKGCEQKFEAALKAYLEDNSAAVSNGKVVSDIGKTL